MVLCACKLNARLVLVAVRVIRKYVANRSWCPLFPACIRDIGIDFWKSCTAQRPSVCFSTFNGGTASRPFM